MRGYGLYPERSISSMEMITRRGHMNSFDTDSSNSTRGADEGVVTKVAIAL